MRQSVWALFVYENETPPMRPRVNRIKREGLHVLRHFGQPFTITCIFFVIDAAKTRAATHSSLLKAAPHTGQRLSRVLSFAAQFVQPRMKASRTLRLFFRIWWNIELRRPSNSRRKADISQLLFAYSRLRSLFFFHF